MEKWEVCVQHTHTSTAAPSHLPEKQTSASHATSAWSFLICGILSVRVMLVMPDSAMLKAKSSMWGPGTQRGP